jgi:hypothetical protein
MTDQTRAELESTLKARARHSPIEGEPAGEVEETYHTTGTKEAARVRVYDTLAVLYRNGTIDHAMYTAGRQFEELFDCARLEPLRAAPLEALAGATRADIPRAIYDARIRVLALLDSLGGLGSPALLDSLGGLGSPAASVIWAVLGEQTTLKSWAEECPFPVREKAASRIFVKALEALSAC